MNDYGSYKPREVSKMDIKDVRKEYSRLRSIANKRVMRKWNAGLMTESPGDKLFPKISMIEGFSGEYASEYLRGMLTEVSRFLKDPLTTITGTRKHISHVRKIMDEMGYGSLVDTDEKFIKFTKFMDNLRELYGAYLFDSGDALDLLLESERLNIPIEMVEENYVEFLTNLEAMEKIPTPKTDKTKSELAVKRMINKYIRK